MIILGWIDLLWPIVSKYGGPRLIRGSNCRLLGELHLCVWRLLIGMLAPIALGVWCLLGQILALHILASLLQVATTTPGPGWIRPDPVCPVLPGIVPTGKLYFG